MTAASSARRSNVARKYERHWERGLIGGKAGQRLGMLVLEPKAAAKPPRQRGPQPRPNPEKQRRRRAHDPNRPGPTCQYKLSFATWAEAEAEILRKHHWRVGLHLKAYRCERCGLWHNRRWRRR